MTVKLIKINYSLRRLSTEEKYARLDALTPGGRREVEEYQNRALGYVWGWEDGTGRLGGDASIQFAECYGYRALLYVEQRIGSMPCIRDAYAHWTATGRIGL